MLRTSRDFKKCVIVCVTGANDGDIGQVKDLCVDDHGRTNRTLIVDTGF